MEIKRIYKDLIKHPGEEGFFKHPTLSIWLSETDDRILTKEGFVEPSTGGEYKYYIRQHLHVLKLETFLVKPVGIKTIGNHIDGVKHNNLLSNLEWVTYTGNIVHAYATGLRSDNLLGFLKDLETDEVSVFNTLRECAAILHMHPPLLTRYLNTARKTPVKFKYAIWLNGEEKSLLTKTDIGKIAKGGNQQLIAHSSDNKDIKHFAVLGNAVKFFGIAYKTMLRALDEGKFGNWILTRPANYDEYMQCLELDLAFAQSLKKMGHNNRLAGKAAGNLSVEVTNVLTGDSEIFENLIMFAKAKSFKLGDVNRALRDKNSYREFTFRFLE